MKINTFLSMVAFALMLLCCGNSFALTVPKDIVLMIDNSGSMKKGDPHFVTKNAATDFVRNLPDGTHVAVLIFDHRVNLAVPLTTVSEVTKEDILSNFDIDYQGQFTNIPAAMERAIYELQTKGQEESQKFIIFITDGIVDTGDKIRDIDKTRWLRENLAEDAAEQGIKIFGIAFTKLADFELIQSLAQKTKGSYFRVLTPERISEVFSQIYQLIMGVQPESVQPISQPLTKPPLVSEEPPKPEIEKSPIYVTEAPESTPVPVKPKKSSLPIIILIVLATFGFIVAFFLLRSRRKPNATSTVAEVHDDVADELLPDASIKDVSGATKQDIYKISKKVTKIGRKHQMNDIVIDQTTISRQHAIIVYKNFSYWIIDQGSSNGTFVNGKQIVDEMQLNHGDKISFDTYEFEFLMPAIDFDETVVDRTVFRRIDNPKED
jgi:uncharacterized protein YegL